MAEGIAKLLHPFAEVVIHSLKKDRIEAIYNPISRREIGDDSYLDRIDFNTSDNVIGPYEKTNWDGRKLKSISIVLRDQKNMAIGFLCINLDISHFATLQTLMKQFLDNKNTLSQAGERLFNDDLYERVNIFVQSYCQRRQIALDALTREDKRDLVRHLESEGAFNEKNAAAYVGRVLQVSRATVYNYLKTE